MFKSKLSLVGALLSATAYGGEGVPNAPSPVPEQAVAEIRSARVQLYCGHHLQAMADIRAARGRLEEGVPLAPTRAALDEAAWHARHGRFQDAEAALDDALARLRDGSEAA